MTLAATETVVPTLAGSDLGPPASLWARLRDRFASRAPKAFSFIPAEAYLEPFHRQRGLRGTVVWLNDPAAIKWVMVDNVANYPKTEMELRFFKSIFGEGLLGSEGEVWRRHRRIMAPSFDPRTVAGYVPTMVAAAREHLASWDARVAGEEFDATQDMTDLALQIIARTMFSTAADALAPLVDATVRQARAALNFNLLDVFPITGPARFAERIRAMHRIFQPLDTALDALIAERERNLAGAPDDLLTRLISAKDAEGGARMSASEVRDEMITIFLAGHETTAVTMSWVWYLLSQHPAAEARMHAEFDQVLGNREPTAEDVAKLPYTRMVVEESMRLYPPAPGVSNRAALVDDEVVGRRVRRGEIMLISTWTLHRNPKLWDHPDRFDPERFSPERSAGRPRFAYMPFGAGPHICIGMSLAMSEAILLLATLARRYRLELSPDQNVELFQQVTLRPKHGLKMRLQPRG